MAPGYDDYMPHDLAHYLVEESFGIRLGVFGQLAAGGRGVFVPHVDDDSARAQRTAHRIAVVGRRDMQRSETLVQVCMAEWMRRSGRRPRLPVAALGIDVEPNELDVMVERLDAVATRWHGLRVGDSLEFRWPEDLVFDPARSREGRRQSDRRRTRQLGSSRGGVNQRGR
jgi:hypothetical protein